MSNALMNRLSTLNQPAANNQQQSTPVQEVAPASANPGNEALNSMNEQIKDIYGDIEYMTSVFPAHDIKSLTDYAKGLEEKLQAMQTAAVQSGAPVADHGIIPGKLLPQLSQLTQDVADSFDVGIVEVDDKGTIKLYNKYEQELAGVNLQNALGKIFFSEVAPCTNNRLFLGRFKKGVETGNMDTHFNYTFTYKMAPTPVVIHIYRDQQSSRNFVFVKKR